MIMYATCRLTKLWMVVYLGGRTIELLKCRKEPGLNNHSSSAKTGSILLFFNDIYILRALSVIVVIGGEIVSEGLFFPLSPERHNNHNDQKHHTQKTHPCKRLLSTTHHHISSRLSLSLVDWCRRLSLDLSHGRLSQGILIFLVRSDTSTTLSYTDHEHFKEQHQQHVVGSPQQSSHDGRCGKFGR